jgi:hypothetical protein
MDGHVSRHGSRIGDTVEINSTPWNGCNYRPPLTPYRKTRKRRNLAASVTRLYVPDALVKS